MKAPIVEVYKGIQGEGIRVGTPSIFVRFGGCNLYCKYCDTKFSWKGGPYKTPKEIYGMIHSLLPGGCVSIYDIVFTGGEPLLYPGMIDDLVRHLPDLPMFLKFTIETNGSLYPIDKIPRGIHFWSISPKLEHWSSNYCDSLRMFMAMKDYTSIQMKFVVGDKKDLDRLEACFGSHLETISVGIPIILQPKWSKKKSKLYDVLGYGEKCRKMTELILQRPLASRVKIIPQVHKLIWGNRRKI